MTIRRDTGAAKVPAIPKVNFSDPALRSWAQAVTEWIEVRSGSRGNTAETAVTRRELDAISGAVQILQEPPTPAPGETLVPIGGGMYASISVEKFAESIRSTRLYRDLMRAIDDPTRFDDYARPIRELLAQSIADEAAVRGSSVTRVEIEAQTANESIAAIVEEVTAALGLSTTGIRDTMAAFASETASQAVAVTQLESSLGNYYQDGTPGRAALESTLSTQADAITGLNAQYTVKVTAGGAMAGFGLAATEVNGTPSSAFIISADKFAIVSPSYSGGLTNTPSVNNVPFGVDANGIYLTGSVYINGNLIVDNSITADKIDTRNLTIKDGAGNVVFSSSGVDYGNVTGTKPPANATANQIFRQSTTPTGATVNDIWFNTSTFAVSSFNGSSWVVMGDRTSSNTAAAISGQGNFATLNQITSGNISTYIASAAISEAYIGNLSAAKITSGTMSADRISGGTMTSAIISGAQSITAATAGGSTNSAIAATTNGNNVAIEGVSPSSNSSSNAHGIRGRNALDDSSGLVGAANGFDFYAEGGAANYGPFTGAHDALVPLGFTAEPGDIVVDTSFVIKGNVSNVITEVALSSAPNQKSAIGVYVSSNGLLADAYTPVSLYMDWPSYYAIKDDYDYIVINGLGEGQINVCGEGGNLEPGDLIVTSSMPGKGMKQADDIVRGYTVAKCREHVTFSSPSEVKVVACIYLCG